MPSPRPDTSLSLVSWAPRLSALPILLWLLALPVAGIVASATGDHGLVDLVAKQIFPVVFLLSAVVLTAVYLARRSSLGSRARRDYRFVLLLLAITGVAGIEVFGWWLIGGTAWCWLVSMIVRWPRPATR